MSNFYIQVIGFVSFATFASAFYLKTRKQILAVQIIALVLWSIHYFLLGAVTGEVLLLIGAARSFVFYFRKDGNWVNSPFVLCFFLLIVVISGYLTWNGWVSIFSVVGVIFATFSHWQKDPQRLRIVFLPSTLFWFIYNILVGSYAGLVSESVMLVATTGSIIRENIKTKGDKNGKQKM